VSYVVLDTDVASAILRRRLPGSVEARLIGQSLAITFVTVDELTSRTLRRNWGARRLADLTTWRRHVVTLPFDDLVATTWDTLDARAQAGGRPRPISDMWVGACCIAFGVALATFNVKDFEDFARHYGLAFAGP
jgi:toxin FitB